MNNMNLKVVVPILLCMCFFGQGAVAQDACILTDETLPGFMDAFDARDSGDSDRAISLMESLLVYYQGSPAPYYILGNWYYEAGRFQDAKSMWVKARTAMPG